MRSRATNADHEQTGSIGGSDDLLAIEYDGRLSLDRDAQQPGLRGELDGAEPDRRLIGTAFLIRLLDLDEHPAKPLRAARWRTASEVRRCPRSPRHRATSPC